MVGASCAVCGGPMRPLFTGSYCPRDCDRAPTVAGPNGHHHFLTLKGNTYRAVRIEKGQTFPREAIYGWRLHGKVHGPAEDPDLPMEEVLQEIYRLRSADPLGQPGWKCMPDNYIEPAYNASIGFIPMDR